VAGMTSRERVLAALSHRQPDRVPLDLGGTRNSSMVVEELIEETGEGGGYVFSSCHNLQPDVPLENVLTMFEHARGFVPSFAR